MHAVRLNNIRLQIVDKQGSGIEISAGNIKPTGGGPFGGCQELLWKYNLRRRPGTWWH